jgi:hypothetical protein
VIFAFRINRSYRSQLLEKNIWENLKISAMAIVLMMEAASTSETSVNFYQTTRRSNPEDSHLLVDEMFIPLME